MSVMLWADDKGRIFDHPYLEMIGFSGREPVRAEPAELVPIPDYSRIFYLPGCPPIGWDRKKSKFVRAEKVRIGRRSFTAQAVAAFLAPGWVRTLLPAADYAAKKVVLPMWSYTAVGLDPDSSADSGGDERYLVPAFQVEANPAWDPANFDDLEVEPALRERLADRAGNRLYSHLADCALKNHCFAAKNLFLGRWEAPLPVSRACNAACLGCLSLQPAEGPAASHKRLDFTPSAEETAQVALDHLARVPTGIVSFGQGCEGEPLTEADLIGRAIRLIRAETASGTINLNTNGSDPAAVRDLARAGLDSIRVSLVSPRPEIYNPYVRPKGFGLDQVAESLIIAQEAGLFTMINYLVFPGVSDQEAEAEALLAFLKQTGVQFVHLKNLCIDPELYLKAVKPPASPALGLAGLRDLLHRELPGLKTGYFNQAVKTGPTPAP